MLAVLPQVRLEHICSEDWFLLPLQPSGWDKAEESRRGFIDDLDGCEGPRLGGIWGDTVLFERFAPLVSSTTPSADRFFGLARLAFP
jgi:hypothetical protein